MLSGRPKSVTVPRLQRLAPLRERVYEALLDLIISRALPPGQHLVESELAAHLGTSRQPVREALQRLSTEGWVDLRPALGAFVHTPTEEEADQLLAVRTMLETESARVAAANSNPESIAHLRELCARGVRALEADDLEGVVSANAALHAAITELSGNKVLAELTAQVDRRVRWYYTPVARHRGQSSWTEHAALIDALAAQEGERAAQIMRAHTEQTRRSYHQRIAAEATKRAGEE